MPRAESSPIGKRVGRYTVQDRIGGDAVHEAYSAVGASSAVRLRVLRPEVALNSAVVERFVEAPRSLCGLSHPNMARVEGVETDDLGIPFVVEELCEGTTLRQHLKTHGAFSVPSALQLLIPICDALASAHARDVVHGKLSPDTVLFTGPKGAEQPKVIDCGSVHDLDADSSRVRNTTQYVAPELARGSEEPGGYCDVWSVGVLLYETLAGRAPSLLHSRVQAGDRPSQDDALHAAPSELRALIDACLAYDPHARLPSVTILRDRLKAVLDAMNGAANDAPTYERPIGTAPTLFQRPEPSVIDDEPELEFDAEEPEPHPEPVAAPLKAPKERTMSAVAAAFASMEDVAAHTAQGEGRRSAEPSRVEPSRVEPTRVEPTRGDQKPRTPPRDRAPAPSFLSEAARRELQAPLKGANPPDGSKRGAVTPSTALSAERLERLRKLSKEERQGTGWAWTLLLLLFSLILAFAVPYLVDPEPSRLQAIVGKALKPGVIGMTLSGVVVLVGLWGMKTQTKAGLMRPLVWCAQALAMCLAGVTASWLMPNQGLGPIGFMAHRGLPWISSGFFMFMMLWGMSRGLAQLKGSMFSALSSLLMSAVAAFGGYHVVRQAIVEPMRAEFAQREKDADDETPADEESADGEKAARVEDGMLDKLTDMTGAGVDLSEEAAAIEAAGEGAGEVKTRTQAGASEDEDMQGVRSLEESRKASQRQVHMLQDLMPNATK